MIANPVALAVTADLGDRIVRCSSHEEWLATRGIGGSDVAAIRGRPSYRDVWSVWCEHLPGAVRVDTRRRDILDEGHDAEPYAEARYVRETGRLLERTPGVLLRDPEFPWRTGSPDGFALDLTMPTTQQLGGWEAKTWRTGGEALGPSGLVLEDPAAADEAITPSYSDQVYWYLGLSGLPWWDLVVLVPRSWGMPEARIYRVLAHAQHQRRILVEVAAWRREYILGGKEPATTGSDAERAYRDRKAATKAKGHVREATEREAELVAALAYHRAQRSEHDAAAKLAEAELAALYGDHTYGVTVPGVRCLRVRGRSRPEVDLDLVRRICPGAIVREGREYLRFQLYPTKEGR